MSVLDYLDGEDGSSATAKGLMKILRGCDVERTSAEGGQIRELFLPGDRYVIDFSGMLRGDWQQYDTHQDAPYFGQWVNRVTRETLCYAEGDWSLVTYPDAESYTAALASMAAFYGSPPPAFTVIDLDANTITHHTQERPS